MSAAADIVIRGGTAATDEEVLDADVGISGERVAAIGRSLSRGLREIDARGKLVLPGGVDSHTHIEQISSFRIMTADDFYTATASAAFVGTTTVMCFCAQHRRRDSRRARGLRRARPDEGRHRLCVSPDRRESE
jgi:dihydropyrimidinase